MIRETIQYINHLGYYKTLDIIPQQNGLYFMAISYRGDVVSFERNCTEKRVKDFREKILNSYQIISIFSRRNKWFPRRNLWNFAWQNPKKYDIIYI